MDVVDGMFVGNLKNFIFEISLKMNAEMEDKNIFNDKEENPLKWNACEIRFKRKNFFSFEIHETERLTKEES
jgi:hypothetical protein